MKACFRLFIMVMIFLGLVGCTPQSNDSPVPTTPSPAPAITQTPAEEESLTLDDLPFAVYADTINAYTTTEGSTDEDAHTHEQFQQFVAKCMKERGFQYTPLAWEPNEAESVLFSGGISLRIPYLSSIRDEVVKTGYGVTAPQKNALQQGSQAENNAYRDSLSKSGQEKYDLALLGYTDPYAPPDPSVPAGCNMLAIEKFPTQPPEQETDSKEEFGNQFFDLYRAMEDLDVTGVHEDRRVLELNAEWNDCMTKRGYDLASGKLYTKETVSPGVAYRMALRTKANGELGDKWYNYKYEEDTPEEQRTLLGTEYERKIALDDFECREASDYTAQYKAVQLELEQAFVTKNKKQLDAMLAFAETHKINR